MRLSNKEVLLGQPILKIRAVVRDAMMGRLKSVDKYYIDERVAMLLKQPKSVAKQIIKQLVSEDYLVLKKVKYGDVMQYEITETEKGRRFGIASADPAISREKATQLLNELIERVTQVNATKELIYYVETVKVFGSYLSTKNLLGDIDVAVKLARKYHGDKFMEENKKRTHLAIQKGRVFSNYLDGLSWPHREVMLLLKTKKKGLSLHDEDRDEVIHKTEYKILYEFDALKCGSKIQ